MALITCTHLSKTYESEGVETNALRDVSFTINTGEFVAIMGPSGSGKSTLMHLLGLLDRFTSGSYFLHGEDVSHFSEDYLSELRNQKIGFVFQSFNLLPRTSVYDNVQLPLLYNIYNTRSSYLQKKAILKALKSVGLLKRTDYLSNQLSGGEKQRVAIARAIVNNPDVIFADEPTGNLDSHSGLQVMRILQDLNRKGKTIIMVTHETYTAEHAKRILHMKDGELIGDTKITKRRFAQSENFLK